MVYLFILVKHAIQVAPILKERMMAAGTLMITFQPHKGKAKPKPNLMSNDSKESFHMKMVHIIWAVNTKFKLF